VFYVVEFVGSGEFTSFTIVSDFVIIFTHYIKYEKIIFKNIGTRFAKKCIFETMFAKKCIFETMFGKKCIF